MTYISGSDPSELLLVPESVAYYVCPENPVRLIEAFVDELRPVSNLVSSPTMNSSLLSQSV